MPRACSVEGCDKQLLAGGLCAMHYQRLRRLGTLDLPAQPKIPPCQAAGCDRPHYCKGYCSLHHNRLQRIGRLELEPKPTLEERFWANVQKTDGCWLWLGRPGPNGYGKMAVAGVEDYAHRISYKLANGEIPDGLEIDHTCRIRLCVRPDHLRAATSKQNCENQDSVGRGRSVVRGVTWDKRRQRWVAQLTHNYQNHHIGRFNTLEEAKAAVIAARLSMFTHNTADRERTNA